MSTPASHVWKPSHARVATIDSFVPTARGTSTVTPPPLKWPAKDPGDILDYVLDIGPVVVGNDGDGIATLDVSVAPSNPGDLVLESATADGTRAVLWLSGGQAGTVYVLTFNITTTSGRAIQRSVLLPVLLFAIPKISADALLSSPDAMFTDQNGTPILLGGR